MVSSFNRWVGKVAIVTGASSGIGASIAERLVKEGLQVVALARREDRLKDLAKTLSDATGKLHPIKTDISKEEDVLNAFKWVADNLGPVHILVNNAGIMKVGTGLTDGNTEVWQNTFQVNVLGLCIATREAVKSMKANNIDGHIIHINSIVGHAVPNFDKMNVYPASKFAVTALTETLRVELLTAKSKIKITSISPGAVETELVAGVPAEVLKQMSMLKAEDITEGVIYVLGTPPHVQVHELTIKPIGSPY